MRVFVPILLCYYLIATLGISSAIHTCGGHYAGVTFWGFFGTNTCPCPKEDRKKDNSCCKEKYSFCKITTEHNSVFSAVFHFPVIDAVEILPLLSPFWRLPRSLENLLPRNHAPPPDLLRQAIYLAFRKFLI